MSICLHFFFSGNDSLSLSHTKRGKNSAPIFKGRNIKEFMYIQLPNTYLVVQFLVCHTGFGEAAIFTVLFYFVLFFFGLFRATPTAYGSSQARGQIRAAAVSLYHSSWQCQILNPLSQARDQTCNLVVPSLIHFHCAMTGS